MGYVRSRYDKCVMTLPSSDPDSPVNDGVVLIEGKLEMTTIGLAWIVFL